MPVNWDAVAQLQKLVPAGDGGFMRGHIEHNGTLGTAISKYLEALDEVKWTYSILVEQGAGVGSTILGRRKIDELAISPEYLKL